MKSAQPWMKFHPQDWRADEKLRLCSLAARGLWIEMLAIMHRSERYGHLLIGGVAPTDAQLAIQVGAPPTEVTALLANLENAGVFSRTATGAIYSRRMTRDRKKADLARTNGKNGGNPKLCNNKEKSERDKGKDKPPDKASLKLRGQRPEKKVSEKSLLDESWMPEPFGESTQCREIVDSWSAQERLRKIEAFKAHHIGHQTLWADWQMAWRTWVLNSVKFERHSGQSVPVPKFSDVYREEQKKVVAQ